MKRQQQGGTSYIFVSGINVSGGLQFDDQIIFVIVFQYGLTQCKPLFMITSVTQPTFNYGFPMRVPNYLCGHTAITGHTKTIPTQSVVNSRKTNSCNT